jgi:hypothetical protein
MRSSFTKTILFVHFVLLFFLFPSNTHAQGKIKISSNHPDAVISRVADDKSLPPVRLGVGEVDFKLEKDSKNGCLVSKEGYESVYVEFPKTEKYEKDLIVKLENREVSIEADHDDAMIFSGEAHVGTKTARVVVPKGQSVTVYVNKPGYVVQKFEYHNKPDAEVPPVRQPVLLKDRIVNLENLPEGALVAVGDSEPGADIKKVEVPFGKCVEITISKDGFAPVKKEFCNVVGASNQPPINHKVLMEDRVVKITASPEDAAIALNGKMEAFGSFDVLVLKGKCQRITVTKEGFITFSRNYCNQTNSDPLPILEEVNLLEDEAYNVSLLSDRINTRLPLETRASLSSADAWKILISIVTMEFDVLETVDFNAGYLITAWKYDSFNEQTFTTRSRVIITNSGNTSENNYSIKMVSQYGNGKTEELKDTDYKDWNRIIRKYYAILDEIEMRVK